MLPTCGRRPSPGRVRGHSVGRAWGSRCGVGEARCGGTSPSPPPAVPGASWCWAAGCHGSHLPARWAALPWEPLPSLGAPLPQQPLPPLPPCGAGRGHGGGGAATCGSGLTAGLPIAPRCCPYRRAAGCSAGSLAPRHGVRTAFWGRYGAKSRQRGRAFRCRDPRMPPFRSARAGVPPDVGAGWAPPRFAPAHASPSPRGPARRPIPPQSRAAGRPAHHGCGAGYRRSRRPRAGGLRPLLLPHGLRHVFAPGAATPHRLLWAGAFAASPGAFLPQSGERTGRYGA